MKLEGRMALVTGSSRGVGRETARRLVEAGCGVVINYRASRDEAEATAEALRGHGVPVLCCRGDVSREADCRALVARAVDEAGRLDILVNNAGTTDFLPFDDLDRLTDGHWERVLATNLRGAFALARAARPHLEAGEGEIVNVASIAGIIGQGSSIAYCASKAALINLTMSLARVLAPRVRVNAVSPGFIADRWTRDGLGEAYPQAVADHEARSALQAVCRPDDVAAAIVSLVAGSDLVTGQNLVVDGGRCLP